MRDCDGNEGEEPADSGKEWALSWIWGGCVLAIFG